jgi:hypothetical protein
MRQSGIAGITIVLALVGAACSKGDAPAAPAAQAAPTTATESNGSTTTGASADNGGGLGDAKAREIFKARCATCHGNEGRGDGPGAITLNPKPRNYHDKEWQAKVTDDEISKAIVYGGAAVGKSPMMPANPDLDAQPQVVASLVHTVREFAK